MSRAPKSRPSKERRIAFKAARIMERAARSLRAGRTEWALHLVTSGAEDIRYELQETRCARG